MDPVPVDDMINNKKVVVVMPAYNAAKTIEKTYRDIPKGVVDDVIVVDDSSRDDTVRVSTALGLKTYTHEENKGYGGNQKTCYKKALEAGADIVVMLHPDYQYTPALIPALVSLIDSGEFDIALGSRILGQNAVKSGMPLYKYISNRFLTLYDNMVLCQKLSEYHTGFRAFSRRVLEELPILANSDDFLFDNQVLVQAVYFGFKIGEVACPAKYERDSSSINVRRSTIYGLGVLYTGIQYFLQRNGIMKFKIFNKKGGRDCFVASLLAMTLMLFITCGDAFALSAKFNTAEKLYLNGDYRSAAYECERLFAKYPSTEIKNDAAYLAGLSLLKLNEISRAQDYFEYVINNSKDQLLVSDAEAILASLAAKSEPIPEKTDKSDEPSLFSVQIGSFRNRENAVRLYNRFRKKRYTARIMEEKDAGRLVYKVKIGKFKSKEEAVLFAKKLKRAGYPTAVAEY